MPSNADQTCWTSVLEEISRNIKKQQFDTWFRRIHLVSLDGEQVNLSVPNKFIKEWLQNYYLETIRSATQKVLRVRPEIRFVIQEQEASVSAEGDADKPCREDPAEVRDRTEAGAVRPDLLLNPAYTFENFVVGPSNRLAHAAALAVSEAPSKAYNPLFLHGAVGLGKTHLLQAICHHVLRREPQARILYLSCETFINQFILAVERREMEQFRQRYRLVDVLLVDDIHFLASKESSQAEFFHTFNSLFNAQKQIILSSDSPPVDIPTLEERLISRFKWGLVAPIDRPNLETRAAILRKKAAQRAQEIPDEVIVYLATHLDTNIRELEGAITKLLGHASVQREPIRLELAQAVFGETFRKEGRRTSLEEIQLYVTQAFGVKLADLQSKKRSRSISFPRQICMYLTRQLTDHSLEEIGGFFGGRDHSTVLHACDQIAQRMGSDPDVGNFISEAIQRLKQGRGSLASADRPPAGNPKASREFSSR
jgi:chromosomal replication initiator protein